MPFSQTFNRAMGALSLCALLAAPASALNLGERAPSFSATTLSGQPVALAEVIGKRPVYLKFWATWCRYCVYELPHAQSLYDAYGEQVLVVMVNVGLNDSEENIRRVYAEAGVNLPTIIDTDGDIVARYGVVGTPNHVLIDAEGKLQYRTFLATDELDRQVAELTRSQAQVQAQFQEQEVRP